MRFENERTDGEATPAPKPFVTRKHSLCNRRAPLVLQSPRGKSCYEGNSSVQLCYAQHGLKQKEEIIEPEPSISGVSAEESLSSECDPADAALTLVIGLIARGLLDAMWGRKAPIIQMSYNDTNSTYIPKKVVANCKSEAQLESFMKIAFDMPAGRPVKLAFKPTGEQQKQRFLKEYVAEQLSIAVAVHIDDA